MNIQHKQSNRSKRMSKGKMHKIALLCHGRLHDQYAPYYESALHIDVRKTVYPDIVHNLRKGMPTLYHKLDLIQTVFWPQLHRYIYRFKKHVYYKNKNITKNIVHRDEFNIDLLKSIAASLNKGGFFVFKQNGYSRRIILRCKKLGLFPVPLEFVENKLGLVIKPRCNISSKPDDHSKWCMVCLQKL